MSAAFLGLSVVAWDLRRIQKSLRNRAYYAAHAEEVRRRRKLRWWLYERARAA